MYFRHGWNGIHVSKYVEEGLKTRNRQMSNADSIADVEGDQTTKIFLIAASNAYVECDQTTETFNCN